METRRVVAVSFALAGHVVLVGVLVVSGAWRIDKLAASEPPPIFIAPAASAPMPAAGEERASPTQEKKPAARRERAERTQPAAELPQTSYAAARLQERMRGWRYRPYRTADGDAVPVCTSVTFIFRVR
jgi:hypothetical protein